MPPGVAVFNIRSVGTDRMPKPDVDRLSETLRGGLRGSPAFRVMEPPDSEDSECVSESCQLTASSGIKSEDVLHSRLIQYDENCFLVSVLYVIETERSAWGFAERFDCTPDNLSSTLERLTGDFVRRPAGAGDKGVYAVIPVQHKIKDIDWASESLTEYLTTLLAAGGRRVVPSSGPRGRLLQRGEPSTICKSAKCAIEVAQESSATRSVSTTIKKRRRKCTVTTSVYDVASEELLGRAKVKAGCEAQDIAGALDAVMAKIEIRSDDLEDAGELPP